MIEEMTPLGSYIADKGLPRDIGYADLCEALLDDRDACAKALRGVLHHDDAMKREYKTSPALIRHVRKALGGAPGVERLA